MVLFYLTTSNYQCQQQVCLQVQYHDNNGVLLLQLLIY